MQKTPFAGLTRLNPNESLSTDGFSFQDKNVALIDYFIELALTHRHDGHAPLGDPFGAPSATVNPAGGSIPADITLHLGYTLVDDKGGETLLSETDVVSTEPPFDAPASAPGAVVEYGTGSILIGTYYYGITLLDAGGGESEMSPWTQVERLPGDANARVNLSGLDDDFVATGAIAWRLYRSKPGSHFDLLAEGTGDTYVDDGSFPVDCDVHPPSDSSNTTNSANKVTVIVPAGSAGVTGDAVSFRLYASLDGSFVSPCLVGTFDAAEAGGSGIEILSLGFLRGGPPDVSTSKGGLSKIDPDTELLDWHWLRPVDAVADLTAGVEGDVRLVLQASAIYGVLAGSAVDSSDWTRLNYEAGGGGGGGGGSAVVGSAGISIEGTPYFGPPDPPVIEHVTSLQIVNLDYPGEPAAKMIDTGGGSAVVFVQGALPGAGTYYSNDSETVYEAGSAAVGSGSAVAIAALGFEVDLQHLYLGPPPLQQFYDVYCRVDMRHQDGLGGTGGIGLMLDGAIVPALLPGEGVWTTINDAAARMFTLDGNSWGDYAQTTDLTPIAGLGGVLALEPGFHDLSVIIWSDDGTSVFAENIMLGVTPRPPI